MLLVTPSPRQALVRLSIIFWRPFSAVSRAPASATTIKSPQSGRYEIAFDRFFLGTKSQVGGPRLRTPVPETLPGPPEEAR